MAVRIEDIAYEVVAAVDSDAGTELASQWTFRRYQELVSKARFRHLRQYGQIYLPAPITAGTVTITQDIIDVTGDATALAAWQTNAFFQYPDGFQGMFFRPQQGRTWYRIAQVDGNVLKLETPFAADNGGLFTVGQTNPNCSYYILPRFFPLDPKARTLGIFVADYMFRPMDIISEDQMNINYSNRFLVSSYPWAVADVNLNLGQDEQPRMVEFYPYPQSSVTVHYTYWQHPPEMDNEALQKWVIPPVIDRDVLKEGALIDVMRYEASRMARLGNVEAAAYFRNEYRMQETKWDQKLAKAVRNDRGADDLSFILQRKGSRLPLDFDPIKNAFDYVWTIRG